MQRRCSKSALRLLNFAKLSCPDEPCPRRVAAILVRLRTRTFLGEVLVVCLAQGVGGQVMELKLDILPLAGCHLIRNGGASEDHAATVTPRRHVMRQLRHKRML